MIIAIMGPAGSGKSTAAQHLVEKYGAIRYSFAGPLKELAKRTLDLSDAQCYGTQAEKEAIDPRYGFSARWFLQRLGTEGARVTFGSDFWTRMLIDKIKRENPPLAVIDDARFVNEATAIRDAGGQVWRLTCAGGAQSSDAGAHASEREWAIAPADIIMSPPFGLESLYRCIDIAYVTSLSW